MTLLDVRRLTTYAKDNPSLRTLVMYCASALGVKLPTKQAKEQQAPNMTLEQARAFAQAANAAMRAPNG